MRQNILQQNRQDASTGRPEGNRTHWKRWVIAGLSDLIKPSLKSLIVTIHNMLQQIKTAKSQQLPVVAVADLI